MRTVVANRRFVPERRLITPYEWSLADALGANGIWLVGDEGVGLHTQPVVTDGNMEAAGTAAWTSVGAGVALDKVADPDTGAQALRCVVDAVGKGVYQNCGILAGCRYLSTVRYKSAQNWDHYGAQASPSLMPASAVYATSTSEETNTLGGAYNTTRPLVFSKAASTILLDNWTMQNISIASHTPKAATGALAGSKFVQATAAAMPWQVTGGVRYATDSMVSNLAAAAWPLHQAAGFSMFKVVTITSTASTHLGGSATNSNVNTGISTTAVWGGANYQVRLNVMDGSGINWCVEATSVATFAAATKALLEYHFDSTGATIAVNGTATSAALLRAPSANPADSPYRTMARHDGSFGPADAIEHEQLIRIGRMDTATATKTRRALAAKHGIALS